VTKSRTSLIIGSKSSGGANDRRLFPMLEYGLKRRNLSIPSALLTAVIYLRHERRRASGKKELQRYMTYIKRDLPLPLHIVEYVIQSRQQLHVLVSAIEISANDFLVSYSLTIFEQTIRQSNRVEWRRNREKKNTNLRFLCTF
jgi:hypothetical protein